MASPVSAGELTNTDQFFVLGMRLIQKFGDKARLVEREPGFFVVLDGDCDLLLGFVELAQGQWQIHLASRQLRAAAKIDVK
jgi:hypothetical protein